MEIDFLIDAITPCLIDRATGNIVDTHYRKVDKKEIKSISKGWKFKWQDEITNGNEVYCLELKNGEIQGLVSLCPNQDHVFMSLVEKAPHNFGTDGKYDGVGAHLFAIASRISFEMNLDGYVSFVSKTGLIDHYKKSLGAQQIGNSQSMYLDTEASKILVTEYFKEV